MNEITKEQKQIVTLYATGMQIWDNTIDIPKDSSIVEKLTLAFTYGVMRIVLDSALKRLEDGLTKDEWRELLNDIRTKAS